jgi:hypothetical protein
MVSRTRNDVAEWIWSKEPKRNQYVLFVQDVTLPDATTPLHIRISASFHYELYINGAFVARGPVHGDPQWCQYDEMLYGGDNKTTQLHVAILVHHSSEINLHYLLPAPGGLRAEFRLGEWRLGTDETWRCLNLPMWCEGVPLRGWALDYCEDYDAALEPQGWQEKRFPAYVMASWDRAVLVENADVIWGNDQTRIVPFLQRRFVPPQRFKAFRAPQPGAQEIGDVSSFCDEETLVAVEETASFDLDAVNTLLKDANAFTFDLGREHVGFYALDVDAPQGVVIELSGAELLRDGRPWIFRKNTRYSVRYHTRAGRQRFVSFGWNGFRYLHLVVRGSAEGVRIHRVGCLERRAPLAYTGAFSSDDERLQQVFDLCRYTLAVGAQEHLIDCPTREQTQYWGDALWIAESLWRGFGEPSYLEWYLDGFLHVPFNEHGQVSSTYPGHHITLLDYSLIPLLGQQLYKAHTGRYYKPEATVAKARQLKQWYDAHLDDQGLVAFDYEAYAARGLRNFIDHPGIGWHNFPHPGIDRQGTSCPLNAFFYGFVRTLAEMSTSLDHADASELTAQADRLAETIRRVFYDGTAFHDAIADDVLSVGTAWHSNALAVFFDLIQGAEATRAMRTMLDGYDRLCRCSPYFHFYFLPALRKAGLEREAAALIKREWGTMLDGGATTTWEGFLGDEKDSLCHPWSTAPFLFLLG